MAGTSAQDAHGGHDPQPALSAGAAARRLGVAVATLRSWDRRHGLGPRGHAAGAHRRFSPADMERLEAVCRLVARGVPVAEAARVVTAGAEATGPGREPRPESDPQSSPESSENRGRQPNGRQVDARARGLARCAIRLDAPGVLETVESVLARDGVVRAWEEVIQPALAAVGRKWTESDGRYVEVEHLLSWSVTVALHRVRPTIPDGGALSAVDPRAGRGVLLACAPGEWHCLALDALAAALMQRGVPVRMLGAAVPADALAAAARRGGPATLVVWAQVPQTAAAADLAALAATPGLTVCTAGPGWLGRQPSDTLFLPTLGEAVAACTADSR